MLHIAGKHTSFAIQPHTYEAQYRKSIDWCYKAQGWPKAPKSWLEVPDYQWLLKTCHVKEIPHHLKDDLLSFEFIEDEE